MPSSQLDSIYGWRTSEEACHHGLCPQNSIERRRSWKAIIALEQHRQGQITSGMAYDYCPWRTYTVRRCWAWKVIIDLGLHTHSWTTLGMKMLLSLLGTTHSRALNAIIASWQYRRSDDIDITCHLRLWIEHTN